jgi:hypothetical protein
VFADDGAGDRVFHDSETALRAYGESWLAAHMLVSLEPWSDGLPRFLTEIARTGSTALALRDVYRVSLDEFEQSVHNYMRHWARRLQIRDMPAFRDASDARAEPADAFEVHSALAAAFPDPGRRATALAGLAAQFPQRPEPQVALAYQTWRSQGVTAALPHFQKAFENGTADPRALWDYGRHLLNLRDQRCEQVFARLLRLEPRRDDARLLLAQWHLMYQRPEEALRLLNAISAPPAGQEAAYYEALVIGASASGQYLRAREAFARFKSCPLTADQRAKLDTLARLAGQ